MIQYWRFKAGTELIHAAHVSEVRRGLGDGRTLCGATIQEHVPGVFQPGEPRNCTVCSRRFPGASDGGEESALERIALALERIADEIEGTGQLKTPGMNETERWLLDIPPPARPQSE